MLDHRNMTLAILTGGAGSRMGKPKAWLQIDGKAILQRLHSNLEWTGPTMLVTVESRQQPPAYELFDREVIDPIEQGPLQGVLTALRHSETELTIVVPVDMIGIRSSHLLWIAEQLSSDQSAIMFKRKTDSVEQIEPLPLVCRSKLQSVIEIQICNGDRSLRGLLKSPTVSAIEAPVDWFDDVWTNLNSPEDLTRFNAR